MIWPPHVQSSPAARWLNIPADRAGRAIIALGNLRAPNHDNIFVIGDCAVNDASGRQLQALRPSPNSKASTPRA